MTEKSETTMFNFTRFDVVVQELLKASCSEAGSLNAKSVLPHHLFLALIFGCSGSKRFGFFKIGGSSHFANILDKNQLN